MNKHMSTALNSGRRLLSKLSLVLMAILVSGGAGLVLSPTASAASGHSKTTTYRIKGVSVINYSPAKKTKKSPIIMIHGGEHGKWAWENWASYFSRAGYDVYAFDWYNHGDSVNLPQQEFIKRSLVDVAHHELKTVIQHVGRKPILVGHSMGGLVAAVYASEAPVEKLVLLTPVMPAIVKPDPVPLPVDMTKPYPVIPYEQAKQLFFATLSDKEARRAYAQLVPESPQAVLESTQWTVDVNLKAIKAPKLLFATEFDILTPAVSEEKYAKMLGAEYKFMPGIGHSDILLKSPDWHKAAHYTLDWLTSKR